MAGASVPTAVAKGRRAVDSNVNMVPMIDLLISVIAFLLITAAWVRVGALQSQQPHANGEGPAPITEHLKIAITTGEYQVGVTAMDLQHIPRDAQGLTRLHDALAGFHHGTPGENVVLLQPDSVVRYDDVMRVMDVVYAVWGAGARQEERVSERVHVQFL